MKRFTWFLCVSLLTLLMVSETTNWFQHQQHIKAAGSGEHPLLAGHSLIMRLTFTNGVKYSHGGEPIHLTALAVERMLQSNLDATSIVVSVAPQAFEKSKRVKRMAKQEIAVVKDKEIASSLSLCRLLNPSLNIPRRFHALRWKMVPMYHPDMMPADSFHIPPEEIDEWLKYLVKYEKAILASRFYEWVWDDAGLENLQRLLHRAHASNIPVIGLITPQQTWSWERIPAGFEQKWRSALADLEALHESFYVVDLGQSPALPPECFTDPVHLSHIGSAAIRDTLENIVHQIEKRHHQ